LYTKAQRKNSAIGDEYNVDLMEGLDALIEDLEGPTGLPSIDEEGAQVDLFAG
jgi:hypothetical protein